MNTSHSSNLKIIFFDGVCNLCNYFVDFLIQRDHEKRFLFAPLQGPTAREVLSPEVTSQMSSVIYFRNGQIYRESSAALLILADLGGVWSGVRIFLVLPESLRDFFYRFVARNRYRIFGQRSTCRLPTADEKARFRD